MTKIARCTILPALLAMLTLAAARPAPVRGAQDPLDLRLGVTSWNSISQIHVGLGTDLGEIAPAITFKPNVEFGFGDEWTIITVNGDLVYRFTELTTRPWGLYGGGGLAFNFLDPPHYGSDTDLGINAVMGLTHEMTNGHTGLMEIRLGVMDSPDFKFTLGYSLF